MPVEPPIQQISDEFRAAMQRCQELLADEAQRLGKELAKELAKLFYRLRAHRRFIDHQQQIVLDEAALVLAAVSFWEDILRIKGYHPINCADGHKKAAHIFKWINQFRPIRIDGVSAGQMTREELNINGLFALLCAMTYLKMGKMAENELTHTLYTAMYRDIHTDEWATIFYLYEKQYYMALPEMSDSINGLLS